MITPSFAQTMARYNTWQNTSLYREANRLDETARKADRGAFFGSIHGTLSHLVFGDMAWMFRFTQDETLRPTAKTIAESTSAIPVWSDLCRLRVDLDRRIETWADGLTARDLEGDLIWYSGALKRDVQKPRGLLIGHMFNHQTHHRGQVHCMLTQAGMTPDDTDVPFMPG